MLPRLDLFRVPRTMASGADDQASEILHENQQDPCLELSAKKRQQGENMLKNK